MHEPRIHVYPADDGGCGHYRLRWPAHTAATIGADVHDCHGQPLGQLTVTRDGAGNVVASTPLPPERVNAKTLLERTETAITNNATFLALASPTNAQTLAQVRALTRQMNAVARLIAGKLDSTDGT